MKFTVQMKDPDTLYESIYGAVAAEVAKLPISVGVKTFEAERRAREVRLLCRKWFESGEYLTVEIDTDAQTCTVVPN